MIVKHLLLSTALVVPAALSLLATAGAASAQETYDWTGIYVGASVGATQADSEGSVVYGQGTDTGWTAPDGYFIGQIYQDVDDSGVGTEGNDGEDDSSYLDLGDLGNWLTSADASKLDWTGAVYGGAQWQFGSLVVGGELRATIGDLETSYSEAWLEPDSYDFTTAYCNDEEGCYGYTDLPTSDSWYGWDDIDGVSMSDDDSIDIEGWVEQINYIGFSSNIGTSVSALARVGVAMDRLMVYGVAGPTVATISAKTAASVQETGEINVGSEDFDDLTAHLDGYESYYWEGSASESRVGVEVGIGAEYAITDNVILRGEVSYSDFGSLSVTGVSEDTDATYTVTQKLSRVAVQTGIMFKF